MSNPKIAYICDGYDKCSMAPGCFMRFEPIGKTDMLCRHTLNPKHAVNPICEDPENHSERFEQIPDEKEESGFKYFERLAVEEV